MIGIYQKSHHDLGGIDFEKNCIWVERAKKRGAKKSEDFVVEPKSLTSKRRIPISADLSNTLREY